MIENKRVINAKKSTVETYKKIFLTESPRFWKYAKCFFKDGIKRKVSDDNTMILVIIAADA